MCFQCHLCDYKAKQIVTMKGHYYKVHGAKFCSKSLIHLNVETGQIVSEGASKASSLMDSLVMKQEAGLVKKEVTDDLMLTMT